MFAVNKVNCFIVSLIRLDQACSEYALRLDYIFLLLQINCNYLGHLETKRQTSMLMELTLLNYSKIKFENPKHQNKTWLSNQYSPKKLYIKIMPMTH